MVICGWEKMEPKSIRFNNRSRYSVHKKLFVTLRHKLQSESEREVEDYVHRDNHNNSHIDIINDSKHAPFYSNSRSLLELYILRWRRWDVTCKYLSLNMSRLVTWPKYPLVIFTFLRCSPGDCLGSHHRHQQTPITNKARTFSKLTSAWLKTSLRLVRLDLRIKISWWCWSWDNIGGCGDDSVGV